MFAVYLVSLSSMHQPLTLNCMQNPLGNHHKGLKDDQFNRWIYRPRKPSPLQSGLMHALQHLWTVAVYLCQVRPI